MNKIKVVMILIFFFLMFNAECAEQKLDENKLQKIVQKWEIFWQVLHQEKVEKDKGKIYQKEYVSIIDSIKNLSEEEMLWVQEKIVKIEGKPMTEGELWFSMGGMIQDFLILRWEEKLEKPQILVNKVLPIVMNIELPDRMRAMYISYIDRILSDYYNKKIPFPEKDMQTIIDNLIIVLNDKVNSGPPVKKLAIEIVSYFGTNEKAINSVISTLDEKDEEILLTTLRYIVKSNRSAISRGQAKKFNDKTVFRKLSHIITNPSTYSQEAVDEAILAIGSLQFPEGKEILLKMFNEEKDIKRLEILMRSLCAYGDSELIEIVLKRRYSEKLKDADIIRICNPGDEDYLLKFAQEKEGEVVILALKELKKMPAGAFYLNKAFPLIEKNISHKDKWVRSMILDMLEDKVRFEINVMGPKKSLGLLNETLSLLTTRLPNEREEELQNKIKVIMKTIEEGRGR